MTEHGETQIGERGPRWRRWPRPTAADALVIAMVLLVALPVVVNGIQALRHGWVPEGDNASIGIRAWDTFTRHPPLLGQRSTVWLAIPGEDVFHPGPALFWTLALPVRLFGPSGQGLVIGTVIINVVSIVLAAVFARRRGGTAGALGALALLAVLVWSFGDTVPHDPWNPHVSLFPLTALLFLVWSVLDDDLVALPYALVVASFVAQSHLSFIPIVGLLGVVTLAVVAARLWQARRADGIPRRTWTILAITGVLAAAGWAPVIVQQLTSSRPNLSAMLRVAQSSKVHNHGLGYGADRLFAAIAWRPYWLRNAPIGLELSVRPSTRAMVAAIVVLTVLVACLALALRQRRRTLAALLVTTLTLLVGSTVAAANIPIGFSGLATYNHRMWWPAGMLVWLALGWSAATWVAPRLRRGGAMPARAASALAVGVVLISGAAALRHDSLGDEHGSGNFAVIRALDGPMLRALPPGGRYLVHAPDDIGFFVEAGLVGSLVLHGHGVRTPAYAKEWGASRAYRGEPVTGTLVLLDGARAGQPLPGFRLIATFDPTQHRRELRGMNGGINGEILRTALYLAPGAVTQVRP
ncbi:MAG: hypothetical protein JWN46_1562 [Acidimicrobiales bacterium]|nr:hypothetical protein [Acidimicrobiales bacterium]